MVRTYCAPLKRAEVDTVVLGCTHYPLVAPMLQRTLGRDVRLVSAGHAIAATAQRVLDERGPRAPRARRRAPTASSAPATPRPSASWARASCRCRSATSSWWSCRECRGRRAAGDGSGVEIELWPWGLLLIAIGLYAIAVAAFLAAGRREDARAVAGFIPDCLVLVGRLARDSRIALPRRWRLWLVLAYLALPIDLIPDFLPVAGVSSTMRSCWRSRCACWWAARTSRCVREAWPGPEASLRRDPARGGPGAKRSGPPAQATLRP